MTCSYMSCHGVISSAPHRSRHCLIWQMNTIVSYLKVFWLMVNAYSLCCQMMARNMRMSYQSNFKYYCFKLGLVELDYSNRCAFPPNSKIELIIQHTFIHLTCPGPPVPSWGLHFSHQTISYHRTYRVGCNCIKVGYLGPGTLHCPQGRIAI